MSESQLRVRRSNILEQARSMLGHKDSFSALECERFDSMMREADNINLQLERLSFDAPIRHRAGRDSIFTPHDEKSRDAKAFDRFLRVGIQNLDADDAAIMRGRFRTDPSIQAAQSVGTGSGGGYTVPDEAMRPLVESLKAFGGLMAASTIINSDSGADLPIPLTDQTAAVGEIISENSQHNEADITFGQCVLQSFLYSSKIVRVSQQLLDDASFDINAYVMKALGERIGRHLAGHLTTGDGNTKPRGITVAATSAVTTASPTAITGDELTDLMFAVDPAYRANGSFLMSDTSFALIRKLKDQSLRPLYGELSAQAPSTLLGRPVIIDSSMPNPTAALKPIIFGDLHAYFTRLVRDVRVLRLTERYAEYAQVGFIGFLRADGDLADLAGVRLLTMHA